MRQKVLLIDDDRAVRESLACALSYENYLPLPAESGEEALRIAASTSVDLALLDLNLPGASGWDTFERLTADFPLLPVIVITARPDQLATALGAGAGALMEKPIDFPKLLETMRRLLAEPPEIRLARLTGRPAEFHHFPKSGRKDAQPCHAESLPN